MARITDGKRTVEIEMREWKHDQWTPDWSDDFFGGGGCTWNEEAEAWNTDDVDYSIDYAMDWKRGIGDFYDDQCDIPNFDPENRMVDVTEV